jgi:hypothetical protein
LDALVLDESVLVEAAKRRLKLDIPTEQPYDDAGLVTRDAPLRTGPELDESGPIPRPVRRAGDEREASLDSGRKAVFALNSNHAAPNSGPLAVVATERQIAVATSPLQPGQDGCFPSMDGCSWFGL